MAAFLRLLQDQCADGFGNFCVVQIVAAYGIIFISKRFEDLCACTFCIEGNQRGNVYAYEDMDEMRMVVFDGMADFAFTVNGDRFTAIPQGPPETRFAAMQRIQEYTVYRDLFERFELPEADARLKTLLASETVIETPVQSGERPLVLLQQYFNFASYVTIVGLFNIMIVVSTVFNRKEFRRRTLISRTRYAAIQRGIMLGHLVIVAAVYLLVIGGTVALYGPDTVFGEAGSKMLLGYGAYTLSIALLGFFITRVVNDLQVGTMLTNLIALGMSFISGAFVPAQWLSEPVLKASQVFPMYWFIRGNELAMQQNAEYWKALWVTLLMCAVLLVLIFVADYRKTRTAEAA